MSVCWFAFYRHNDPARRLSDGDRGLLAALIAGCRHVETGLLHLPAVLPDRGGDPPPALAIELRFATGAACERALADENGLGRLAEPGLLTSLSGGAVTQQVTLARDFPEPEPAASAHAGCSFLVAYPGPTDDGDAWRRHYISSHVPIMIRLPAVRNVAVYTPAAAVSPLPFRDETAMLRNKVVFATPAALAAALASPVREELRADVATFPPFAGGSEHVPMETVVVGGGAGG